MTNPIDKQRRRGRAAVSNNSGRYEKNTREVFDDGWETLATLEGLKTQVHEEPARSIISKNSSPDIPFNQSINPYRGCEHGCIYCYARPTHTYLGHSAGLDFETKLYAKPNAAQLLERELAHPNYKPQSIALGTNTDPYQPIERDRKITRSILEVFERTSHPATIVTKSAGVVRDIDILEKMAKRGIVKVALSITTLDAKLARTMEPRASTPAKRIDALRQLHDAGIPTIVMAAPIIPAMTDHELENILERAKNTGVSEAGYVLLRMPLEIKDLFEEWLLATAPDRAKRVINTMASMHEGNLYDSTYHTRQRGTGPYAQQIAQRFRLATTRLGLANENLDLRTDLFTPPTPPGTQLGLF